MTIRAQESITTSLGLDDARALVEANLVAAGVTLDSSDESSVTASAGRLLKYRLLGIWITRTDELPISVDVEFASSPAGTTVTATVADRQGAGLNLNLDPDKFEAAGHAAIAAAFSGLAGVAS